MKRMSTVVIAGLVCLAAASAAGNAQQARRYITPRTAAEAGPPFSGAVQVGKTLYRTYFKKEFPARAFIGAGTLLFNARFEMQGIAVQR